MNSTVNNKVLQEIQEKTNASTGMFIQKVYKDTLRNLLNIFSNIYYIDRDNNSIKVKCFHANQERAIAKSTIGDNITLPVITISETSTASDDDRRRYTPILIHDKYWHKRKNRAIRVLSMAPKPLDISYNINIWSKYREDLDQIREHVFILFNPDLEIKTKSSNITKAFFESESDSQQVEADDQQDRILKKTITIKVQTYLENPKFLYTSTGKIEQINYEITLDGGNATETFVATQQQASHAEECLCTECVLPLYLITGSIYNFAAVCAANGHQTGCQCTDCTLAISLINGNNFNLPINCATLDSIDELN
jgi:hypothetical protein